MCVIKRLKLHEAEINKTTAEEFQANLADKKGEKLWLNWHQLTKLKFS